ncbi:MAG: DUF58 domain-containing protein [Planctomycetaceae bacterium]
MSTDDSNRSLIPAAFGAGNTIRLLTSAAFFLAAYVIPLSFPEWSGSRKTLLILGGISLAFALITILFPRLTTRFTQRMGIRSRMLLPREGIVYLGIMLIVAIGALTGGSPDTGNILLLVFGMMAGPFVLNGWVVDAMLTRVTVSRQHPLTTQAGVYFGVDVKLRNDKPLLSSRLVEVRDVVQGRDLRAEPTVTFVRVGPKEERFGRYELCINRRGLYRFGPMRISSRFPLGIGERGHVVEGESDLLVHPAIGRLLPGWKRRERDLAESVSRANARMGIFDDDFHSIREYRAGDSSRAIHWRSSARHGQMMVKEHQQHREAELIVMLDFFQTTDFPEVLQETAVSLAATLCVEQTRQSSAGTYRLLIAGKEQHSLEVVGAARFRDAALKALAICQPSAKAALSEILTTVAQGPISSNSRCVLITPRPAIARSLCEEMAKASVRHETQIMQRLLILECRKETLDDVFAVSNSIEAGEMTHG